ncbi:hypothetical protein FOB64_003308 [Candida albicans]|uniref:Uncharacterized protein n=1 Tax=Candida albicans TaxID=5476 RepID=A0A8H6C126_CANAX|nr:hypothetical protein FOB64_003308 [Candida albicans]
MESVIVIEELLEKLLLYNKIGKLDEFEVVYFVYFVYICFINIDFSKFYIEVLYLFCINCIINKSSTTRSQQQQQQGQQQGEHHHIPELAQETGEIPHPHELFVPLLTFIPTKSPVLTRPWVLLTSGFIEENFIELFISFILIFI